MAKKRFYGLIHNNKRYEFLDWESCDNKMRELPGPKSHKGFSTKRLMREWFDEVKPNKKVFKKLGIPVSDDRNINKEISMTFDVLAELHKPCNLSEELWNQKKSLCYQKLASCFREL